MDEFLQALARLRQGAGRVAKGTLENMGNVREREQEMLGTERDRNADLINRGFGGPQQFEQFQAEQPPLPKTPGQSLGDFFERLAQLRRRGSE